MKKIILINTIGFIFLGTMIYNFINYKIDRCNNKHAVLLWGMYEVFPDNIIEEVKSLRPNRVIIVNDSSNGNSVTVEQRGNGSSYVEINGKVYSK